MAHDRSTATWQERALFAGSSESISDNVNASSGSSGTQVGYSPGGHAGPPSDPQTTNRARQRRNETPPDPEPTFNVDPRTGVSPEPRTDALKNEVKNEAVDETLQRVRDELSTL